tara:strand:+ start:466 stop:753 length:288 start_codon:yes stop_codon:yes gene_type:complete
MVKYKNVDGVQIQMTAKEEADWLSYQDTPLTKLQILMNRIRLKRNSLLKETDWWGASDNTMTAEQTKYRKDLRDITNGLDTVEKAENVKFPTKPS